MGNPKLPFVLQFIWSSLRRTRQLAAPSNHCRVVWMSELETAQPRLPNSHHMQKQASSPCYATPSSEAQRKSIALVVCLKFVFEIHFGISRKRRSRRHAQLQLIDSIREAAVYLQSPGFSSDWYESHKKVMCEECNSFICSSKTTVMLHCSSHCWGVAQDCMRARPGREGEGA
jgi:hypothetical protein